MRALVRLALQCDSAGQFGEAIRKRYERKAKQELGGRQLGQVERL